MSSMYCSMIHGGLNLDLTNSTAQHCCLRDTYTHMDLTVPFWSNDMFVKLREINKKNIWDPGCNNCQSLEKSNNLSMRQGMNVGLGIAETYNISGPVRIDLMFDTSCNLACRTCGPWSSTFWQKHLKEHHEWHKPILESVSKEQVINTLSQLDLSNLRMLVFCGGETLLGQIYWDVAEWLTSNVPNAKEQLTLCFQTNGTQSIREKNYKIIDKFHLVKLHFSLDGVGQRFEYLRWPAKWNQVANNILKLKNTLPSNVMFVIEETVSVLNLAYLGELDWWAQKNFTTNREGDIVNHTKHLAVGTFSLSNCSQEYYDEMCTTPYKELLPVPFKENIYSINRMIQQIKKFDAYRNEDFNVALPAVSKFYKRFM